MLANLCRLLSTIGMAASKPDLTAPGLSQLFSHQLEGILHASSVVEPHVCHGDGVPRIHRWVVHQIPCHDQVRFCTFRIAQLGERGGQAAVAHVGRGQVQRCGGEPQRQIPRHATNGANCRCLQFLCVRSEEHTSELQSH